MHQPSARSLTGGSVKLGFASRPGPFLKRCPCSPGSVPCGYLNLNLHTGCPFDCSYCVLQAYLEDKRQGVFYTNWADLEAELPAFLAAHRRARIGTGELSDSLAYEPLHPTASRLIELFRAFPEAVFEFKTKAAAVRALLAVRRPPKNIVVSWSLNPPPLVRREERLTPPLGRRLRALAAVQDKGYAVGIHLDPLILFPGWKRHYRELIRRLAGVVRPGQVAWWSLGALRFAPELEPHIFRRRDSQLFWGELVQGEDRKYRYFTPLRLELFRFVRDEIRARVSRHVPLYLCMEEEPVWRQVLPEAARGQEALNAYLHAAAMAAGKG